MKIATEQIQTISEITRSIKRVLEPQFDRVAVQGEISNFTRHTSGHLYFTLKDADAQLSAVMFRGNAMNMFFRPQPGMEVICRGSITVYEPRGNYQLLVTDMQPRGEGALQVAFERLKRRLHEEGLFDDARKRPIPAYPRTIAIVTSPTGAAIRDFLSVIARRNPSIRIIRVPVLVQGAGAAEDIAAAVDSCNEVGEIDIIVLARGGGSIEDLWAFNEESVARAISRSAIPVVSAIGHEIDFTIADFVADLRAATPSVAGELLAPSRTDLRRMLDDLSSRMRTIIDFRLADGHATLRTFAGSRALQRPADRARRSAQVLDEVWDDITRALSVRRERWGSAVRTAEQVIAAHDPDRPLRKGYAVVSRHDEFIRSASVLSTGDDIDIRFIDGTVQSTVTGTRTA